MELHSNTSITGYLILIPKNNSSAVGVAAGLIPLVLYVLWIFFKLVFQIR